MLTKRESVIVVEKREKVFEDGGKGYFITAVQEDGKVIQFWAPGAMGEELVEHDADKWVDHMAIRVVLRRRVWNGVEKLSLVEWSA